MRPGQMVPVKAIVPVDIARFLRTLFRGLEDMDIDGVGDLYGWAHKFIVLVRMYR